MRMCQQIEEMELIPRNHAKTKTKIRPERGFKYVLKPSNV